MNKKTFKIAGVIAIIIGTIALYVGGASESEITGIVAGVIVVIIAVGAIFKTEISVEIEKTKAWLQTIF